MMPQFLAPAAFWTALVAAPIILLYLLKLRRRRREVSSTLLWSAVTKDLHANAPFQRLRRNLLLLLQLLLLAALVIALARPVIHASEKRGLYLAAVLDLSGSMQAKDAEGGRSRLDAAKEALGELIENLGDGDQMMLLGAGPSAQVLQGFTPSKEDLHAARKKAVATDGSSRLGEALVLAASAIEGKTEPDQSSAEVGVVHVFGDGAGAGLDDLPLLPVGLRYFAFGSSSENAGIVALQARILEGSALEGEVRPYEIFARVRNYGSSALHSFLTLRQGDRDLQAKELDVPAEAEVSVLFQADLPSGPVEVAIDQEDVFALDNRAWAMLRAPRRVDVLLVGGESPFLERAFAVDPDAKVARWASRDLSTANFDEKDLVVFDGVLPAELPDTHCLIFGPVAGREGVVPGGEVAFPRITGWQRTDPILRFVSLADVHLSKARVFVPESRARSLVRCDQGPLIMASERRGKLRVWFGFDLLHTDWPLRASFPVLLANAVAEVRGPLGGLPAVVRVGESVTLPVREPSRVKGPDGRVRRLAGGEERVVADTWKVGVYEVTVGEREMSFVVSLLDEQESNLAPGKTLVLGGAPVAASEGVQKVNREIWPWFLLGVLVVALGEWYAFHRGIV